MLLKARYLFANEVKVSNKDISKDELKNEPNVFLLFHWRQALIISNELLLKATYLLLYEIKVSNKDISKDELKNEPNVFLLFHWRQALIISNELLLKGYIPFAI